MAKFINVILITLFWYGLALADDVQEPPEIVLDAPPANKETKQQQQIETETITVYESKIFPGFRPCTPEDYRKQDYDPIACQDDDVARMLSTREEDEQSKDLIVEDETVPQGNIYKLRFERFKRKKN